jgi:signal transduction histidine kinase
MRSLRARILSAALLWTLGLFIAAFGVSTIVFMRHRHYAVILHGTTASHDGLIAVVVIACLVGGFLLVRRGLSPLERLRGRLVSVRAGTDARITGSYPSEVQPLVDDLNALLEHRDEAVRRAVAKAGDLAHGLKTPLAVLTQEAERARAAGQPELAASLFEQVLRMRRQIDYHLAHARAAASGATLGATSRVRESVDGLVRTMERLYAARNLEIRVAVDPALIVQVQRQDLDEMLGNLLDNACKWGRTRIAVTADVPVQGAPVGAGLPGPSAVEGSRPVVITIDDDGPGVPADMRHSVLQRGVRADEAAPGSGLGLAIVRDLADLYGGEIALEGSPLGGLRVLLRLPAARSAGPEPLRG